MAGHPFIFSEMVSYELLTHVFDGFYMTFCLYLGVSGFISRDTDVGENKIHDGAFPNIC